MIVSPQGEIIKSCFVVPLWGKPLSFLVFVFFFLLIVFMMTSYYSQSDPRHGSLWEFAGFLLLFACPLKVCVINDSNFSLCSSLKEQTQVHHDKDMMSALMSGVWGSHWYVSVDSILSWQCNKNCRNERKFHPSPPLPRLRTASCLFQSLILFTYFFLYLKNQIRVDYFLQGFMKCLGLFNVALHALAPPVGLGTHTKNGNRAGQLTCRLLPFQASVVCPVKLRTVCILGICIYVCENSFCWESPSHNRKATNE